jgi:hypothetical protein
MTAVRAALACILVVVSSTAHAQAQTGPKIELGLAVALEGASSAGTTRAELIDPAGNPVTLFEASHRTTRALGVEGLIGFRIKPSWTVEVSGGWSRPDMETTIRDDFEDDEPATASLGLDRYTFALGLVRGFRAGARVEPFARVAAGWVRERTSDRTLADDGVAAHAGAGLKYRLREGQPGWLGHIALRAELRLVMRQGGIVLGETGTRWSPSALAGLTIAR